MDLLVIVIGAVAVAALLALARHRDCERERLGYRCRRTYKNYCEGCQPDREARS